MKRKDWKKIVSVVLAIILIVINYPEKANATNESGNWKGIQYEISGSKLTLSGNGEMPPYKHGVVLPWYSKKITNYVISEGITTISDFINIATTDGIKLQIPKSVICIKEGAFSSVYSYDLTIEYEGKLEDFSKIIIEENNSNFIDPVKLITEDYSYNSLTYTYPGVPHSGVITGCKSVSKEVILPQQIFNKDITAIIHCDSFCNSQILESVIFPEGYDYIGEYTFKNCTSLEKVYIPKSIKEIAGYAFMGCTSLTDVYYAGTKEEWNEIKIGYSNNTLTSAIIHCSDSIDVTGVLLDKGKEELLIGETMTLIPTILPENADVKDVVWSSSNENVATVSNGIVTAKSVGTALIKVETFDGGYTAECEINVFDDIVLSYDRIGSYIVAEAFAGGVPGDAFVLMASYDSGGKILEIQKPEYSNGKAEGVFISNGVYKIKSFVWEEQLSPFLNSAEIIIN